MCYSRFEAPCKSGEWKFKVGENENIKIYVNNKYLEIVLKYST